MKKKSTPYRLQLQRIEKGVPFWPKKEFADLMANKQWDQYVPKGIGLNDFIEKWLPGLKNGQLKTVIFMTSEDFGIMIEPQRLIHDLHEELKSH